MFSGHPFKKYVTKNPRGLMWTKGNYVDKGELSNSENYVWDDL